MSEVTFQVVIDVNDTNIDDVQEAIVNALYVLELPDGDTLFIDRPIVELLE